MKYALLTAVMAFALIPMGTQTASAHGCHRDAQQGRYGIHHHRGPDCDRVAGYRDDRRFDRRDHRDYRRDDRRYDHHDRRAPHCQNVCKYVGPFKTCKTVCR